MVKLKFERSAGNAMAGLILGPVVLGASVLYNWRDLLWFDDVAVHDARAYSIFALQVYRSEPQYLALACTCLIFKFGIAWEPYND